MDTVRYFSPIEMKELKDGVTGVGISSLLIGIYFVKHLCGV